jgi:hypothetical protein
MFGRKLSSWLKISKGFTNDGVPVHKIARRDRVFNNCVAIAVYAASLPYTDVLNTCDSSHIIGPQLMFKNEVRKLLNM